MHEKIKGFHLVVHIGAGKTGTTSIQKMLAKHENLLRKKGMSYLGKMLENAPVKLFDWQKINAGGKFLNRKDDTAQDELYQVLAGAIDALMKSGINKAIWSNETIFDRERHAIPVLNRLKQDGVSVDVVVYVRRHESWVKSAYAQWGIKHKTYNGPLQTYKEWMIDREFLFFPRIQKWIENEGLNILLRNYDAADDVVTDFFEFVGIGAPGTPRENINASPDNTLLLLWALYNGRFEEKVLPEKFWRVAKQAKLVDRNFRTPRPGELFPTKEDLEEVIKYSEEDKKKLNALLTEQGQPLLEVKPPGDTQLEPERMQWNISVATLEMVYALQEQVFRLEKKIAELEHG